MLSAEFGLLLSTQPGLREHVLRYVGPGADRFLSREVRAPRRGSALQAALRPLPELARRSPARRPVCGLLVARVGDARGAWRLARPQMVFGTLRLEDEYLSHRLFDLLDGVREQHRPALRAAAPPACGGRRLDLWRVRCAGRRTATAS